MMLQREALLREDVVSIYGSSELTTEVANRANDFFSLKPTGFQICPVGAAGNHTLLMAEKIAAHGAAVKGKQIVIILSPVWFFGKPMHRDHVAGNFSPLQTINLLNSPALEEPLRRRFVRRMLDYPTSLKRNPLLARYLANEWEMSTLAKVENRLLWPLLETQALMLSWEDYFNSSLKAMDLAKATSPVKPRTPSKIHWDRRINELEQVEEAELLGNEVTPQPLESHGANDAQFLANLEASKEWDDFALLLDSLHDLHADALIISVPLAGRSFDRRAISREARAAYYDRIESMSAGRGFACATFSDHDLDTDFLIGSSSHLDAKGWLHVNRLLNDFYHDRLLTAANRGAVSLPNE